jgi:hypothetical protein
LCYGGAVLLVALAITLAQVPARTFGPDLAVSVGAEGKVAQTPENLPPFGKPIAQGVAAVRLDAGMRFLTRWYAGAYGGLGTTWIVREPVTDTAEIPGAYDFGDVPRAHVRTGALVAVRLWPHEVASASLGVGFGHEWLVGTPQHGYEGSLHIGADLSLGHGLFVGGELVGSVGRYDVPAEKRGVSTKPDQLSVVVEEPFHGWVGVALRVRLAP